MRSIFNSHKVSSKETVEDVLLEAPGWDQGCGVLRTPGSDLCGAGGREKQEARGISEDSGLEKSVFSYTSDSWGLLFLPVDQTCLLPAKVRMNEVMSSLGFELLWECCCKPIGCY